MENGKVFVTWGAFIRITLTILALSGAIVSWGWTVHTARPHNGTATEEQFIRLSDTFHDELIRNIDQAREDRKGLEEQLQRVEDKIDNLIQKLN